MRLNGRRGFYFSLISILLSKIKYFLMDSRFVELLKEWDVKKRPSFIDMAFSSERSVEDELERVSKAEMFTVVISYAVMFAYIAIALGHFRSFKTILVGLRFYVDFFQLNKNLNESLFSG